MRRDYYQTSDKRSSLFFNLVCRIKVDLGFLIDGSGSIEHYGRGNFKRMLKFVKVLISAFSVCKRRARIGLVLYSTRTYPIFRFRRYCSKRSMFRAIDRIRYVVPLALLLTMGACVSLSVPCADFNMEQTKLVNTNFSNCSNWIKPKN